MLYISVYDKILFIVLLCFSSYNVMFSLSMNKAESLFKLLGIAFFIPLGLCAAAFLFGADIPAELTISFAEFCLSLCILVLLIHPYNNKDYKLKAAAIILFTFGMSAYIIMSKQFFYFALSSTLRNCLIGTCIVLSVTIVKKRNGDQNLVVPLMIWLSGILFSLFENQEYIREIVLTLKVGTYAAFFNYFYSTTYKAYKKKISDSQKRIETMEHSLNKEVKKRVFEIERSNERLLEISKTDMLTKSFNKITILNIIEKLINSKREDVFSILMFDIDNFKTINDSLGHVTGDLCLKTLAYIAAGNIREVDYLGRYGGDEFIIVLPSLAGNEAKFVAERFKKKVNETSNPKFTVSIGISTYPDDGKTVNELISAADKGLYKSKSKGKNCISHASLF